MTWQKIPLVRLLIPFLLGIVCYTEFGGILSWGVQAFAVLLGVGILLGLNQKKEPSLYWVRIWGFSVMLELFCVGYFISHSQDDRNQKEHLQQQIQPNAKYLATITSPPELKTKSIKTYLQVTAIQDSNKNDLPTSGQILAFFQLDTLSTELQYGDQILFQADIKEISDPLNPYAFDSRTFLHPQNIYHQTYIPAGHWTKIGAPQINVFYSYILACRAYLLGVIKEHISSPNEYAVAAALIWGVRDELSSEINNAYADTGAMHVLSVSGLHVGILIAMVSFLFNLVRKPPKWWKKGKVLLLLILLWMFALLAGAGASVLRSAAMFTFVLLGQFFDRKISIYNSLGASAFLLLSFNPFLLYDIGFQLSYIALGGIVYLHPRIYKRWYIENKIGDWIWNGTAVSLAAQLATLPISLYYFHQFPVFFWLSGLVVTAAAGLILGLGLALLCLNWVPFLGALIGYLLYLTVWQMNSFIFMVQQLPGAVWDGFWLEYWEMWLWYLVIGGVIALLLKRQLKWAFIPLAASLVLFTNRAFKNYEQEQQSQLCIYNSPKSTILSYIYKKNALTLTDSAWMGSPKIQYAQQNHLWAKGVQNNQILTLQDSIQNQVLYYKNKKGQIASKRLLLYSEQEAAQKSHTPLEVDYVLVHGNPKLPSILQINDICTFEKVIFDASNSFWKIKKWVAECEDLGIEYVDVSSGGAWVVEL